MLEIRKKTENGIWHHIDTVRGQDFSISKFYFKTLNDTFQIEEYGGSQRFVYPLAELTLYDETAGGTPETFATMVELEERLKDLNYPGFDYANNPGETYWDINEDGDIENNNSGRDVIIDGNIYVNGTFGLGEGVVYAKWYEVKNGAGLKTGGENANFILQVISGIPTFQSDVDVRYKESFSPSTDPRRLVMLSELEGAVGAILWVDASADYLEPAEDGKSLLINSIGGFVAIESGGEVSISKTGQGTLKIIPSASVTTATLTGPSASGTVVISVEGVAPDAAGNVNLSTSGTGDFVLAISPAMTGTPTAPTAAPGTNTTQLATTAFVAAANAFYQLLSGKNVANGYSGLDSNARIPGPNVGVTQTDATNRVPYFTGSLGTWGNYVVTGSASANTLVLRIAGGGVVGSDFNTGTRSLLPLVPAPITATSYAMPTTNYMVFVTFTGTSPSTWTLPTIANASGITYIISNQGTATITVNSNSGANDIFSSGSSVNTLSILANQGMTIRGGNPKIIAE